MRAIVLPAALEGEGEFAGWTVFTKQHLGQRGATLLPGIPCLEERGHPIEPWDHIHGTTRSHHDDDVLICTGELFDELILGGWKLEAAVPTFTFAVGIKSHRHDDCVGA